MAPSAAKLWGLVQAADGTTPESLAEAAAAACGSCECASEALEEAPSTPSTHGSRGSSRDSCGGGSCHGATVADAADVAPDAKLGPTSGEEPSASCRLPAAAAVEAASMHGAAAPARHVRLNLSLRAYKLQGACLLASPRSPSLPLTPHPAAAKPCKPAGDPERAPEDYGKQRRRGRRALKAHLDDLHIA